MSDARFREIERRWKATPSQEHTLQYLYELIRVGYDIELGLLDVDLLRSYRAQLQNDLRSLPLQRILILGRGLHEVMYDIQSYRHEEALADIPQELIAHYMSAQTVWPRNREALMEAVALYRALHIASSDIDLTNEWDYEVISLHWLPSGSVVSSGSLINALGGIRHPPATSQPYLLAIIRTDYLAVVRDELQDDVEIFNAHRYYGLYYQLNEKGWEPLPGSGYIYGDEVPIYEDIRFNPGMSIYEIFGDLDEERDEAECTMDEINSAQENVENYRNQIAGTIGQTHLEVWQERGFIKVDLIDRFSDIAIQSWEDEVVFELIQDGFFHGPVDGGDGSEFHQSVYDYAEMHQLLPWQQQGGSETGHLQRNPTSYVRSWHAALGYHEPKTVILAFGTYEALAKAAIHYGVTYNRNNVEMGTYAKITVRGQGPSVPMLTVRTHDGRYLQIWQKVRDNPTF